MVSTQERTVHQRDHLYGAYFHFQQANEWPSAPRCPTFTPRLFGAWDGTTVKDARGGAVEVRVRFQVHRRARSVSDIPRAHSRLARRRSRAHRAHRDRGDLRADRSDSFGRGVEGQDRGRRWRATVAAGKMHARHVHPTTTDGLHHADSTALAMRTAVPRHSVGSGSPRTTAAATSPRTPEKKPRHTPDPSRPA